MELVEFILYVADQKRSTEFYGNTLQLTPTLNVPGMTEFELGSCVKLGLMPEQGIAKIIGNHLPHPESGNGIPRAELYLKVNQPDEYMKRALEAGATLVNHLQPRDWGDAVGYIADPDGHIIAFAS